MAKSYSNPWIPAAALEVLAAEGGRILDVGGAAAPYARADHVLDIQPFCADYLRANAWGEADEAVRGWRADQYTSLDLCSGTAWPFDDKRFDLALCSHSLEDLRDPMPVVAEMNRVAKRILVICPSRLLEQTLGIEHPRFCGFDHHPWMVSAMEGRLVFRRKTMALNLPACHLRCPFGMMLTRELGSMHLHGSDVAAEEEVHWSLQEDADELAAYLAPYRNRTDLFEPLDRARSMRHRIWHWRQRLGRWA